MSDPAVLTALKPTQHDTSVTRSRYQKVSLTPGTSAAPDWDQLRGAVAIEVERSTPQGPKKYLSSAIMLTPTLGITAAHSLEPDAVEQLVQVNVSDDFLIRPTSRRYPVKMKSIQIHPNYKGNRFDGVDLARFELSAPLPGPVSTSAQFKPVVLTQAEWPNAILQRIGFGNRNKASKPENRRTWVLENFKREWVGTHYLSSEDEYGYPGDSGGPVYLTRTAGQLELVGIHVGRMLDPDTQKPRNRSNTLIFTDALIRWIQGSK
jgi:V8-like Glu-specific endopeptidase